jgi:hypothetical protein
MVLLQLYGDWRRRRDRRVQCPIDRAINPASAINLPQAPFLADPMGRKRPQFR